MDALTPTLAAPPQAIYFLHIAKTGGTSVHRFLEAALPPGRMSPVRTWDDFAGLDPDAFRRHRVFSAHLMDSLESYFGVRFATVTLLRDPVERTVSHYAHAARDPSSPLHALAGRVDFADFCRHPDARWLIENYQARQLAARIEDPVRLVTSTRGAEVARIGVAAALERLVAERFGDDESLLARARARLRACIAVGVTERLDDTLNAFADALGLRRVGTTPFENFSYNRPGPVDAATRALVEDMTRLDAALHREATMLLDARVAALRIGTGVEERPAGRVRAFFHSRAARPRLAQRAKVVLSDMLRSAPLELRAFLSRFYVGYRILVDRRVGWRGRVPLALGLLYLPQPVDLIPATVPVFGWLDNLIAVWVGCAIAVAHVDKRVMSEIRNAAVVRFDLPPYRERRRRR